VDSAYPATLGGTGCSPTSAAKPQEVTSYRYATPVGEQPGLPFDSAVNDNAQSLFNRVVDQGFDGEFGHEGVG
jgi:hypothetical protein